MVNNQCGHLAKIGKSDSLINLVIVPEGKKMIKICSESRPEQILYYNIYRRSTTFEVFLPPNGPRKTPF